ncbi:hypothetical protein C8F04DRAFT_483862 [Mycena alexandri]|uniref:C2H2-type domain-containing protein n=1 Tax=Mycena alexandri TaxID=1745969 RepID=A0AAD6T1S3_9AGAR|nr:hypothetical protein C8F04DRAFT_483862 [Mycena alexandri]
MLTARQHLTVYTVLAVEVTDLSESGTPNTPIHSPLPVYMTQRAQSPDDDFTINVDYVDSSFEVANDLTGLNDLHDRSPSHSLRPAASYGMLLPPSNFLEEALPPGGPHRRTQSDRAPFPDLGFHPSQVYNFPAVADDYSSPLDLPPTTDSQPEQSHVEWGTAYPQGEGEDFSQLLSPFPQSPPFSWRSRAGSDASSIGSASPSPSGYGLSSPFLHPDSVPSRFGGGSPDPPHYDLQFNPGFEPQSPAFRGRLERRGKQHKLPLLHLDGSPVGDLIKFEDLSIEDGGSTEQYYSDYALFLGQSTDPAEASGSHSAAGFSSPREQLLFQSYDHDPFLHPSDTASIRSASSLPSSYNPLSPPDDGSFAAGRSRSSSHASHNGDNRRQTRAQRRRDHSPYPVADSSTNPADATYWPAKDFAHPTAEYLSAHNLPTADSANFTAPSPSSSAAADGASSPSASWRRDTSAQDRHDASAYRSVATDATVIASKNRRREPTRLGKFICDLCGNDFTAKHNLKNHVNSHNSVKDFGCKDCGQFFGTPHVLKRHRDKCKSIMVEGIPEPPM